MTHFGIQRDPAFKEGVPDPNKPTRIAPRSVVGYETSIKGRWPRMANPSAARREDLLNWLHDEIRANMSERNQMIEDLKGFQRDYWARPETERKDFPFQNAANIVIPVSAIDVEAIQARLMNVMWSVEPHWSIRPRSNFWVPYAPKVQEWFQYEVEHNLNVFEFDQNATMEFTKLGTCIGKAGYERLLKKSLRTLPDGTEEEVWYECHNGATVDYVPVANFYIRMAETDPQRASWIAEEHHWSWGEMKRMAASGRISSEWLDEVKHHWQNARAQSVSGSGADYEAKRDQLQKTEPLWQEDFTIFECWCTFDIDEDGYDEELVVEFELNSKKPVSIRYNWYQDLHRPYRHARYIHVEGRFHGIGICKINEQFQAEITAIHRQRLDNATIANMRMLVVTKNSGYGPGELLYPGKIWQVDAKDDITSIQMGDVYNSSFANESSAQNYSDKRTGVNEVILGLPHEGTPPTATSDIARLAEANKRFDLSLRNYRWMKGLLGQDVLVNYQQFGNQDHHWLVQEEDGAWVDAVLRLPPQLASIGAAVELTATSSIVNQQIEQQQRMALFQIITNYHNGLIQLTQALAQYTGDPAVLIKMIERAIIGGDAAMRALLSTFNIQDADEYTVTQENPSGIETGDQAQAGGAGATGGIVLPSGMEGLLATALGGGGAGYGGFGFLPGP